MTGVGGADRVSGIVLAGGASRRFGADKLTVTVEGSSMLERAVASVAAGADGLILEVHPDPERALSDGYQSLNFAQFLETIARCRAVASALGKTL